MKKLLVIAAGLLFLASCAQKKEDAKIEAVVAQDTSTKAKADHTLTEIRDSASNPVLRTKEDTISAIRD